MFCPAKGVPDTVCEQSDLLHLRPSQLNREGLFMAVPGTTVQFANSLHDDRSMSAVNQKADVQTHLPGTPRNWECDTARQRPGRFSEFQVFASPLWDSVKLKT